mmetsp:Transcript_14276/g.35610  ORF Transcript_14276/g.35610 Transcript_14276/m.35610 type:complete len:388 (-) Transcript_14276:266-1429(-)|eukprot:CAMPEP_0182840018 /NCGR_PEP_ID=MMETSP0006_2-20121128/24197_1 /TAXON_ID=97485 /ORGANISM="Prymnesium parvum, Strain Texoma1" /LENGTH=387 /DNA_ID=CAMNT_0024969249 /DNA_START=91 /DNA_END=1254 /DNA_ORIENTATION=+
MRPTNALNALFGFTLLALGAGALQGPIFTTSTHRPALRVAARNVRALAGTEIVNEHTMSLLADAGTTLRQTDEAIRAAQGTLGWWGSYIKAVEDGIFLLHDKFESLGAPYPYGTAIFCFVLGVKILTLPLNWNQLSSSAQMKAIKPQQDLVRDWFQDNKQMEQMATAELFEKLNVNPLAGCLPSLAQIPVFLGVYYSVTSIAKAEIYNEGFLWIPNLSGPIADRREGLSWLTDGWIDGAPKFGWEDTLAYLTIPIILVCTQTAALYLLGSFDAIDETKKETASLGLVLRILPLMIGWFALNAPSGLGLYWVFNNILTTTQTVIVKKVVEKEELKIDVDLAVLGPRRDPLPMAADVAPDWVKRREATEDNEAEASSEEAKPAEKINAA